MNLDGKTLPGVEELEEKGKPGRLRKALAEYGGAVLRPEFVEGFAAERVVMNHALRFGPVDEFP
jgi:hypothetical protein